MATPREGNTGKTYRWSPAVYYPWPPITVRKVIFEIATCMMTPNMVDLFGKYGANLKGATNTG